MANQDIIGLWEYTQEKRKFQYIVESRDDVIHFRQELSEFGTIDEPLTQKGEWFECTAPHGRLRLKLHGGRMVAQFQRQDSPHWSSPSLARRMRTDIRGLFYQGGVQSETNKRVCTINEKQIRWFTGQSCTYQFVGRSQISIRLEGVRYMAEIQDDGDTLQWSDGDIWVRRRKAGQKHASLLPEKKNIRKLSPGSLRRRKFSEPDKDSSKDVKMEAKPRSFSDADIDNAMKELGQTDVNDRLAAAFKNKTKNQELQDSNVNRNSSSGRRRTKQKRQRARWDDDNLAKNDAEKVPRMKIDEAPTPFEDMTEEEILAMSDNNLANLPNSGEINIRNGANKVLLSDPNFMEQMAKKVQADRAKMDEEDEEDSSEERERKFRDKRAAHYNEGFIWKAIKQNPDFISGKEEIFE